MKRILLIILSLFMSLITSSFVAKADDSVTNSITIYKFTGDESVSESTDYENTDIFTSETITISDGGSYTLTQNRIIPGYQMLGYYQAYTTEPVLIELGTEITFAEGTENVGTYYEWWKKTDYDFTYYIYYNMSSLPQEFYISETLDYSEFVSSFPTSYKNLNSTAFFNDEEKITKITIDELYDIYVNSSIEGNTYHILYAAFEIKNEIQTDIVDDVEENKSFSEWWKELDKEIKAMIIIIFLLFVLMILSLSTGKRRYSKW